MSLIHDLLQFINIKMLYTLCYMLYTLCILLYTQKDAVYAMYIVIFFSRGVEKSLDNFAQLEKGFH